MKLGGWFGCGTMTHSLDVGENFYRCKAKGRKPLRTRKTGLNICSHCEMQCGGAV